MFNQLRQVARALKSIPSQSATNFQLWNQPTTFCRRSLSNMRFVQFEESGKCRVGVEVEAGGDFVDLCGSDQTIPDTTLKLIEGGPSLIQQAQKVVESPDRRILKRTDVKLLSPITGPQKVICIGMNYRDHCTEQNYPIPTEPVIFSKFSSAIIGPNDDVVYPELTDALDWEVELTIVIGKGGKNIKERDAMDHVFGYTVAHDVSARDWQMQKNGKQWLLGKTMDDFCPLGPAIVTTNAISDPHKLGIRCRVNGETVQESNTEQMIFKTASLIQFISQFITLVPGDIILTGTPPGVGVFRKPEPVYLKRGDVVECEIDEIGTIRNRIV
ncbi:fumarylacetoacetate hydrolase domain-containing protein 2-like [Lytechinus variegatus]|uniref:fumarylacetoacetate hydrolase domain-containing protein 2-like n=1 Tax=Lytechinus variegatus TaxID=7654 RepID=UPI001BB155EB|nr:fumarylacetoacetate hydrolase domain-containing protein 2-like [Lytechinus variegatus]